MERINRIIKHELYLEYVQRIKVYEKDRIFCKHDMVHFLDVCRLAEIDWVNHRIWEIEKEYETFPKLSEARVALSQINRELIYAAGLLHDIGRWQEYEDGVRHEIASCNLATEILEDAGFGKEEIEEIVSAISNHRNSAIKDELSLSGFLYRADKMSRPCYVCEAEKQCDWSALKKNLKLL